MKNEEKIVELLSEMLKRQDRNEDRFNRIEDELILQRGEMTNLVQTFNTGFTAILEKLSSMDTKLSSIDTRVGNVETEIRGLRQNDMRLTDHEARIKRLEEDRRAS